MARDGATYRGARRNFCIRDQKMMWGPEWYYKRHDNSGAYRGVSVVTNLKAARYIPATKAERKAPTTTNAVHQLLKMGNYAEAIRTFFGGGGAKPARRAARGV